MEVIVIIWLLSYIDNFFYYYYKRPKRWIDDLNIEYLYWKHLNMLSWVIKFLEFFCVAYNYWKMVNTIKLD